jgi:hypothetical protein
MWERVPLLTSRSLLQSMWTATPHMTKQQLRSHAAVALSSRCAKLVPVLGSLMMTTMMMKKNLK